MYIGVQPGYVTKQHVPIPAAVPGGQERGPHLGLASLWSPFELHAKIVRELALQMQLKKVPTRHKSWSPTGLPYVLTETPGAATGPTTRTAHERV